jgi:hypothetical protein
MDDMDVGPDGPGTGALSRRELLTRSAALGVVVALPAVGPAMVGTPSSAAATATGRAALSPGQAAVLEAIVERLVPADANGPGAKEAGVATYIERSLAGGLAGGLTAVAPLYTSGLSAVDAYAVSAHGGSFAGLPPDKQDAVLTDIQSGKATGFTPDSATFFRTVQEHTLQGMFSDPVYGGNKHFAGWNLVGYAGVKMPVSASDQKMGVKVKAAHKSTYADGQFAKAKKEALA